MRTNVQVVLALVASAGLVTVVHAQSKVELEYRPQKSDGSLDAGVQFKYDIRSQKSAARTAPSGSKGAGPAQGQAGFGYGSAAKDDAAGAKGAKGRDIAAAASGGKAGGTAAGGAKGSDTAAGAAAHGKGVASSASGGKAGGSAASGAKGAGAPGGAAQAGFGYGDGPGSKADSGAKGAGASAKNELNPTQARQTPKTDFGSVVREGVAIVPDVAKTPTPGGPVPLPYPNTPIDVKPPPVVKAPLPILRPIDTPILRPVETPRPILAPTPLPIIAQPVPVAPKPVIVEPVPQPAIKLPYSAPVNRR